MVVGESSVVYTRMFAGHGETTGESGAAGGDKADGHFAEARRTYMTLRVSSEEVERFIRRNAA